jgi:hypothetical protein
MNGDTVKRLLVSGDDAQIITFHLAVANVLNALERREQTVIYTCMSYDFEWAMEIARNEGLTVQELHGAGDNERYELLCGDEAKAWKPRKAAENQEPHQ